MSVLAALLAVSAAGAQEAKPQPQPEPKQEEAAKAVGKVNVRGRNSTDEGRESTVSKIVYNRDELLKQGDTSIFDVLKRLPGVSMGAGGPQMRGLGGGYTQILVDGKPQSSGFQLSQIAPDMIEKIEIVPTASAEYSTRAVAGTINVILRKNLNRSQRKVQAFGGTSSLNDFGGLNLTLSNTGPKFGYTTNFGVNGTHSDYYAYSSEVTRNVGGALTRNVFSTDHMLLRNRSMNNLTRLNWTLENGATLTAQSLVYFGKQKNEAIVENDTLAGVGEPFAHYEAVSDTDFLGFRPSLEFSKPFGEVGRFSTTLGGSYDRTETSTPFYGYDTNGVLLADRYWEMANRVRMLQSTGKMENTVRNKHKISAGWDLSQATRTEKRDQWDQVMGQPVEFFRDDVEVQIKRAAFYVQDEFAVNKQLTVYGGLRWEGSESDVSGIQFGSFKNRTSVLSPIASFVYRLKEKERDQFRVGLARTYNQPDPSQLVPRGTPSIDGENSATNPLPTGNPKLKPEISLGLDVAYENYFGKTGVFTLSAYIRDIEDAIGPQVRLVDGLYFSRPENNGDARAWGAAADVKFPIRQVWAKAADVDLRSSLSWNRSKVNYWPSPYNVLAAQVPFTGTFGFDWRPNGKLTVGSDAVYNQGRLWRTSDRSLAKSFDVWNVDFFASYKFSPKWLARVSVQNAFAKYSNSLAYYNFPSGGNMLRESWQDQSRAYRMMVEYKF